MCEKKKNEEERFEIRKLYRYKCESGKLSAENFHLNREMTIISGHQSGFNSLGVLVILLIFHLLFFIFFFLEVKWVSRINYISNVIFFHYFILLLSVFILFLHSRSYSFLIIIVQKLTIQKNERGTYDNCTYIFFNARLLSTLYNYFLIKSLHFKTSIYSLW